MRRITMGVLLFLCLALFASFSVKGGEANGAEQKGTSVHPAAPGSDIPVTWTASSTPSWDIFFDDMESGPGKWTTHVKNPSPQTHWDIVPSTRDGRPTKVWADEPEQPPYSGNQETCLSVSYDIHLSGRGREALFFGMQIRLNLEDGVDFLRLQFSPDGGTTWSTMHSFTGGDDTWVPFSMPIPDSFKTDRFRFRFVLETEDSSTGYEGVEIDDVGVGREGHTSGGGGCSVTGIPSLLFLLPLLLLVRK